MELQFQNKPLDCLRPVTWEIKNAEQTQEVKLPDAMPDVGKVLGAWGQPVMRSKDWRSSGMGISGGVMTWVLYAPEDGTFPRVVETWIPYQLRWEFPQTQRDGAMVIRILLKLVDARAVSPRKLMVRACVSGAGEALEPVRVETFVPVQVPEDLCLLRRRYPVCIRTEAGEKTFTLEEELQLPAECEKAGKLIHYTLQPEILDQKLMTDKVVFRGAALLQGLCRCEGDELRSFRFEIPFSQYAELEHSYEEGASVQVVPVLTDLELELGEGGKLRLKASLTGQYVVYDRPVLELVEDAYSPGREVALQSQTLELPVVLETQREIQQAAAEQTLEAEELLDVSFLPAQPEQYSTDKGIRLGVHGTFQLLYRDPQGTLQGSVEKWEGQSQLPAESSVEIHAAVQPSGTPFGLSSGGVKLHSDVAVERTTCAVTRLPMVASLALGEKQPPDPERPSLILRRMGRDRLWDVAKQCQSTEAAIRQANQLEREPEPEQMLLIPVL